MSKTIKEAQEELEAGMENPNGIVCPCCHQLVKLYQRAIYAMPARALLELFKLDYQAPGYYHIRDLDVDIGGSDFSKLKHWGLIKKSPTHDSGMWKITDKGRQFCIQKIEVPQYCYIYNNETVRFSHSTIGIETALKKKFDYSEIMGWYPNEAV